MDSATKISELSPIALTELQNHLKSLSYYKEEVDGIYGHLTGQAFAQWKADNYLAEPLLIGPASWELLRKQSNSIVQIDWKDFNCKVSDYFSVKEVTHNDKRRIPQSDSIKQNIILLANELDNVRSAWGKPIGVTSWYRPPAINAAVGGVPNSQHITGKAADIYPINGDIWAFQKWLDSHWNKALGYGAKKGFVHVDLRPGKLRWNY